MRRRRSTTSTPTLPLRQELHARRTRAYGYTEVPYVYDPTAVYTGAPVQGAYSSYPSLVPPGYYAAGFSPNHGAGYYGGLTYTTSLDTSEISGTSWASAAPYNPQASWGSCSYECFAGTGPGTSGSGTGDSARRYAWIQELKQQIVTAAEADKEQLETELKEEQERAAKAAANQIGRAHV